MDVRSEHCGDIGRLRPGVTGMLCLVRRVWIWRNGETSCQVSYAGGGPEVGGGSSKKAGFVSRILNGVVCLLGITIQGEEYSPQLLPHEFNYV